MNLNIDMDMNPMNEMLKSELVLVICMIIYLIMGLDTPQIVAYMVDSLIGKIIILFMVLYLFMNAHPILAVVATLAAFDLMRRSNNATGLGALKQFAPSEERKMSQFTALNQFPYTLEQEVVSKMAPIVRSGSSMTQASYKPLLDNLYDASTI